MMSQDRCLPFILVHCSATVCQRKGSLSSIHVHSHSVMSKLYQAYILYHDTNYIDEMIPELLNHINARADSSTCIKALRPIFFSMSHSRHFMILLKIIRHGVSCSLVRHIDTLYLGPIWRLEEGKTGGKGSGGCGASKGPHYSNWARIAWWYTPQEVICITFHITIKTLSMEAMCLPVSDLVDPYLSFVSCPWLSIPSFYNEILAIII